MEITLIGAITKVSDLKICKQCKNVNWYANEECVKCLSLSYSTACNKFNSNQNKIKKALEEDYSFYMEEEFMSREEADEVLMDV